MSEGFMKRNLIWLALGFIAVVFGECQAKTKNIDPPSEPNSTKPLSYIEDLRKKAEAGNFSSQKLLADLYFYGEDYKEAVTWYLKIDELENTMYQKILGYKKDIAESCLRLHEMMYADTHLKLGIMYLKGRGVKQDYKEAAKWFLKSADKGNVEAQRNLGLMYSTTEMGVNLDYKESAKWLRKAADQGDALAQYFLGLMYYQGQVGKQDYKEAAMWYRKSAEQGHADAQQNLGMMYFYGQGVEQDYKVAFKWFNKAAEQGNTLAQLKLGAMYEIGIGVIEDYVEAYKWYLIASVNDIYALKPKESIKSKMTAAQIAEAQRRAKAFAASKETNVDKSKENNEVKSTGTGFFINSQGYFLTSQHVIEGTKTVKILTGMGIFPAKVIHADSYNDIAILKVEGHRFGYLLLVSSRGVKTGDKVYTVGFPNVGLQGFEPKYTEGIISSLSGAKDDPRYFQISTPVQPGNSGGPLVNDMGEVVGIITARLSEANSLATTGALPQNVNYALKSSYVLAFLEVVTDLSAKDTKKGSLLSGIKAEERNSSRASRIKNAQEAVVLVLSYY
jgi:uncharacterized protein